MLIPEEFSDLFRPEELEALEISGIDLWSLLPEELEGLKDLQNVDGILEVVSGVKAEIGEIASQISSEVSKYIGNGLGLVAGFLLPGLGNILGSILGTFLGGLIGDLFGPDRIPKDALEEAGLGYHRCLIYIPPGAYKNNRNGLFPPENRGGVWASTVNEEDFFPRNALENVIASKSSPHVPIARFVRFDKNDKPVLSACIGFTREGYALFDEWPGSENWIGEQVSQTPYSTVPEGAPAYLVDRARKVAVVARSAGLPGGFHGPPGFAGKVYRLKRRIMTTFATVKEKGYPIRSFLFGFGFWKYVPGFEKGRPTSGESGSYSFSFRKLKRDLRGWFVSDATRENPGKIRWIPLGIAGIAAIGLFLLGRRRSK